ncbi:MAG: prepilin peptidase [Winogradskyella sp.]
MALNICYALLLISLTIIIFQDIKYRAIHITLPLVVLMLSIAVNYFDATLEFSDILYNVLFIIVNVGGLFIYFSVKEKRFFNPVDTMLGTGDILFFIAITPLFGLKAFILFFIIGLIFSLLTHLIINIFKKVETIPLAGYLAVFLGVNVVAKTVFKFNIPII